MRHSVSKPDGVLMTTAIESDGEVHQDTVMCGHCGRHWIFEPGSGRKRGWCMKCGRITCGRDRCDICVPHEQMILNMEQGKPWDHVPILVSSGWDKAA